VSFTILRLTQRAHGGDPIERTKRIEGNEASIGRGTDCDLQLPDLTIGLRHAVMRATGRGQVTVEAIGEQTFEVNGKVVRKAEIRVSDKPALTFGTYLLTFDFGATQDEIVVTVTQSIEGAGGADTMLAKKAFSLSAVMFSLRGAAWLLGFLILAGALAVPAAYFFYTPKQQLRISPLEQWSSGALSSGHAFLQHNCEACHVNAFRDIPDSACMTCHQNGLDAIQSTRIAERVHGMGAAFAPHPANDHAEPNLLMRAKETPAAANNPLISTFNMLFGHPTDKCVSCHTEHVGTAGQRPPQDAPAHPTVAQVTEADCAGCHAGLKARIPDTALLDVSAWSNHPDFRPLIASLAAPGRPKVETNAVSDGPFDTGLKFSHKQHLATSGDVAREAAQYGKPTTFEGRLSCTACHHPDTNGRSFEPIEMTRDCSACHSLQIPGIGGQPETLPHGQPDRVVEAMLAYYKSGGASNGSSGSSRMLPGGTFTPSTTTMSDQQLNQKVRAVFMNDTTGPHPCYGCHTFKAPDDPNSLVFKIEHVKLVDQYLPRSGFDHSVPQHVVDANGKPLCLTCHGAMKSDSLSNVVIPGITACKACHGAKSTLGTEIAASNCTECHGYHSLNEPPTREIYMGPWRIPGGM